MGTLFLRTGALPLTPNRQCSVTFLNVLPMPRRGLPSLVTFTHVMMDLRSKPHARQMSWASAMNPLVVHR